MGQVTDPMLLEQLNTAPAPQKAPQRVYGKPKAPPPQRPADIMADELSNESKVLDNRKKARDLERGDLGDAAAEERKNAGFLRATLSGHNNFTSTQGSEVAPSLGGDMARGIAPDLSNMAINSPERQKMEQAKESFIRGILRLESGAVINDDEYDRAEREFFPMPGDGPDVIKQKRISRIESIKGFRMAAGILADEVVDEWNAKHDAEQARISDRKPEMAGGLPKGSDIDFTADKLETGISRDDLLSQMGVNSKQEAAIKAYLNLNSGDPDFTAQKLAEYYRFVGVDRLPDQAALEQGAERVRKGYNFGDFDTSGLEMQRKKDLEEKAAKSGNPIGDDGASLLFKQGATGNFLDEASGIGGAIASAITGGSPLEGYKDNRDIQRLRVESAREKSGALGTAAELAGGLVAISPSKLTAPAMSIRGAAKEGAVVGSVFGAGEGEGVSGTAGNAFVGAGLGAGAGAGISALGSSASKGISAFRNRSVNKNRIAEAEEARKVIEAGDRVGVPVRQPDARPSLTDDYVSVATSPATGENVRRQVREDSNLIQSKVSDVGGDAAPKDKMGLGESAQNAVERHRVKTSQQATALYNRVDKLTENHSAKPVGTVKAIDDTIAELKATAPDGNSTEIKILESIKADFETTGLSVKSLQAQRKAMRKRLSEANIDQTADEKMFSDVLDIAATELETSLSSNPKALGALKNANQFWRDRSEFRQKIARKIVGTKGNPVPAETAAKRIDAMMREGGDFRRFQALIEEMDGAEVASFKASIAENIGKNAKGEFSLAYLSKNIENMSDRSKAVLFGKDHAKLLDDLATVAGAKARSTGRFNGSPTGGVNQRQGQFSDIMLSIFSGGGAIAAGAEPVTAVMAGAAGAASRRVAKSLSDRRKARLLLNTSFVKWLKNTPKTAEPEKINSHFKKLDNIAAREVVIANDVAALQNGIRESFAGSSGRAAASSPEQEDGVQQ